MKKVLLASIMVTILLATALHVNAVSVQKQESLNEETSGTYDLKVWVFDEYFWPSPVGGLSFAKVVITSKDNPNFKRVGYTGIFGIWHFSIPDEYEAPTVNAYKSRYEQTNVLWINENEVDILMKYTGKPRTVNTPFQWFLQQHPNLFPILRLLLQRLGLQ